MNRDSYVKEPETERRGGSTDTPVLMQNLPRFPEDRIEDGERKADEEGQGSIFPVEILPSMGDREGRALAAEESSAEPNGMKLCARQGSGEGAGGTRVRTMSKIKAPDPPGFYRCKGPCRPASDMQTCTLPGWCGWLGSQGSQGLQYCNPGVVHCRATALRRS